MEEIKLDETIKKLCQEIESIHERLNDVIFSFKLLNSDILINMDPEIENKIKKDKKVCGSCIRIEKGQ